MLLFVDKTDCLLTNKRGVKFPRIQLEVLTPMSAFARIGRIAYHINMNEKIKANVSNATCNHWVSKQAGKLNMPFPLEINGGD